MEEAMEIANSESSILKDRHGRVIYKLKGSKESYIL